jgi:hypothetical protein
MHDVVRYVADISNTVNKNNGICFNIDLPLKIIWVIIYEIIIYEV